MSPRKRKHPLGQRYGVARPYKGRDVLFNFTTEGGHDFFYTPRHILEALDDAADEMNYSNYHTDKFGRAQEIIRRYCEEHKIPLGMSKKQYVERDKRQAEAHLRRIERCRKAKDMTGLLKAIEKYENRNGRDIK